MSDASPPRGVRQRALQEELSALMDVVSPANLVDLLLERAFQLKATDIHLDPNEAGLRVRLRVDGLLHNIIVIPADKASHVVSRIKVMAKMDITERRTGQDGHFSNVVLDKSRDIRVGSGPTIYGERVVLRLMPDHAEYTKLEELGLEDDQIQKLDAHIRVPYGVILVVGPVGSGKTTTLYSCLNRLNHPSKSIVTIEDPVERRITGINQIQTDGKIEFGFIEALRGVLRQDPNIIMVGEIRDAETAHIGCRAGLTGVTVLSTLHANDTAAAIDVFREFDVPPMFIANSLEAIVAQRLLRVICSECKETYRPDDTTIEYLQLSGDEAANVELARGTGCDACFGTGYFGRVGIYELMGVRGSIREAVLQGQGHNDLMALARDDGMMTMEEAGVKKALAGITTLEEVHRVVTV